MILSAALHDLRRRIRAANYLRKWVLLGAMIGVVGGLGAIVFYTALEVATRLLLGVIAGYVRRRPRARAGRRSPRPPGRGRSRSPSRSAACSPD